MLSFLASTLLCLLIFGWVILPIFGALIRLMEATKNLLIRGEDAVHRFFQPRIQRIAPAQLKVLWIDVAP
jgi:fumarate reductase subunit D